MTKQRTMALGADLGRMTLTPVHQGMNPADKRQKFDWSVDIHATRFTMVQIREDYPRVAPINGYQGSRRYNYPHDTRDWQSSVNDQYAIRTEDGKYGLMEVTLYGDAEDDGVCGRGRPPHPELGFQRVHRSAIGGLSTNSANPDRIDREYQFLGRYPGLNDDCGQGVVFTATQIAGTGLGPELVVDAAKSGVPALPGDQSGDAKTMFLLDGGSSTALAHATPDDKLVTRVKMAKHTGLFYYIHYEQKT